MIKLEIADYCQNCPGFEAEVENPTLIYNALGDVDYLGDTLIRCEHRERCKNVYKQVKKRSI